MMATLVATRGRMQALQERIPFVLGSTYISSTSKLDLQHNNVSSHALHNGWQNSRDEIHTLKLSSIDQGLVRSYVRMGLCYPLSDSMSTSIVSDRLGDFVTKTVRCLPYLSGRVVVNDAAHNGSVAVQFSLDDVLQYKPIIRHLNKEEFPCSYEELNSKGMPADKLISDVLNRMPNKPNEDDGPAPVLVIQANFIRGGLIVTLYLHHSAGDGLTLAHIIRGIFRDGFRKAVDLDDANAIQLFLEDDAANRLRMSEDNGKTPDRSRLPLYQLSSDMNSRELHSASEPESPPGVKVLSFSITKLKELKVAINDSISRNMSHTDGRHSYPTYVSTFNVLASLLWRNIVRARLRRLVSPRSDDWALLVPVNIRGRIQKPLTDSYLGNGVTNSMTRLALDDLLPGSRMYEDGDSASSRSLSADRVSEDSIDGANTHTVSPLDASQLALTTKDLIDKIAPIALALRSEISKLDAAYTENLIATQNSLPNVGLASRLNVDLDTDVFITTWVDMPVYSASDLGMGLGNAEWARKTSSVKEAYGALILEPRTCIGKDGNECNVLEVMMQLREDDIMHIIHNEEVMRFVEHTA